MDAGVFVPLAVFAAVVLIVAITSMTKLRDKEMEVHQRLYIEEMEHQRKMKELAWSWNASNTESSPLVRSPESGVRSHRFSTPDSGLKDSGLRKNMGLGPSNPPSYRVSLTWPVILITLGVIFLLEEFVPHLGFSKTWPVLLVVIGILKLIDSARPPRPPEGPRL